MKKECKGKEETRHLKNVTTLIHSISKRYVKESKRFSTCRKNNKTVEIVVTIKLMSCRRSSNDAHSLIKQHMEQPQVRHSPSLDVP